MVRNKGQCPWDSAPVTNGETKAQGSQITFSGSGATGRDRRAPWPLILDHLPQELATGGVTMGTL